LKPRNLFDGTPFFDYSAPEPPQKQRFKSK
jgi:hypothetical protein